MAHIHKASALSGGAKALFDSGITVLPQEYIQASRIYELDHPQDHERVPEVPVLYLSKDDPEQQRSIFMDGCQNWGLFQLLGHGITVELMQKMRNLVSQFFDLPAEERAKYFSDDKNKTFKMGTSHNSTTEKTMHWHDYMYQVCYPPPKEDEQPKNVPNYREVTSEYNKQVGELARKLLAMLSELLGLKPGVLEARVASPWRYTMRMNYYPPCPNPAAVIGLGKHADLGTLTVLQQDDDIEGLQVFHNQQWVNVKPLPGALVIILGEQMEILTNGKYKSAEHRAIVNTSIPRISIVSFILPAFDNLVSPLDELLNETTGSYKGIKFQDYYDMYFDYLYTGKRVLNTLKH